MYYQYFVIANGVWKHKAELYIIYAIMRIFIKLFFLLNFMLPECRLNVAKVVFPAPHGRLSGPGVMCGSNIHE
jgi:hypothetical protein